MKLFLYVEGQEEEMFVNRLLRGHLHPFGVEVQKPILAATSFRIGVDEEAEISVGGVTNYDSIRADIQYQFELEEIKPADALTTLIDLYALPPTFPGSTEAKAQGLTGGRKAAHIEEAWKAGIARQNFFPYFQVHEFEALVLTKPSALELFYPEHSSGIEKLCKDCAAFSSPEEINESRETSPSHRILNNVPTYRKIDGFRHLQDIGIPEIRAHCPRFNRWIEKCERGFR